MDNGNNGSVSTEELNRIEWKAFGAGVKHGRDNAQREYDRGIAGDVQVWHFDQKPPTATEWIIDGLLPSDACLIIGGEEKTGKTMFALAMAFALARSGELVGCRARGPASTLIVSPEGSREALRRRMYGMAWGLGVSPSMVGDHMPVYGEPVNLMDEYTYERLTSYVRLSQPKVILMDPLISMVAGADSNSDQEMQPLLDRIRLLREQVPGMSIIVVHHLGKGHKDRSDFHALRGSGCIGAWTDGLITLRREGERGDNLVRGTVEHRSDIGRPPWMHRTEFSYDQHPKIPSIRVYGAGDRGAEDRRPEGGREYLPQRERSEDRAVEYL